MLQADKYQLRTSEDHHGVDRILGGLCLSAQKRRVTAMDQGAQVRLQFGPQRLQVLVEGFMDLCSVQG